MSQQYWLQSKRMVTIRKCAAEVTHSEHMRDEYVRHGIPADRVLSVPFYIAESALFSRAVSSHPDTSP
jgi:hypothetical protein